MKAEEYVRNQLPDVRLVERPGTYVGGTVRYEVMHGRKMIGCDTRQRSAWAAAMRWIKENTHDQA
jgi:hypothetical protein